MEKLVSIKLEIRPKAAFMSCVKLLSYWDDDGLILISGDESFPMDQLTNAINLTVERLVHA